MIQKKFSKRKEILLLFLLLIFFCLPAVSTCPAEALVPASISDECVKIHFISVGQGDSILVELNEDTILLIDAGSGSNQYAPSEISTAYYQYIEDIIGEGDIDYLIASHPDADHINMLSKVITTYQVNEIFYNDYPSGSKTYQKVEENVEKEPDCILHEIKTADDSVFTIEKDGYKLTVFSAGNDGFVGTKDPNNMSIMCLMEYGGKKVLFTGDAETEEEAWFIDKINDTLGSLDIDVLKVGHHGSDTSSSEVFLDYVDAEYAVISCGENNSYGHPKQSTIDKLNARNIKTYITKDLGTIDLYIDSDGDLYFDVGHTVTYTFDGETLAMATVESLTEPLSYLQIKTLLSGTEKSLEEGTAYEWQIAGETITFPYVPTEDVTLEYIAVETNAQRTVSYRYDYISEESYQEETKTYMYGNTYTVPNLVNGKSITGELYTSPSYNQKILAPSYVTEDVVYYVKLTEPATVNIGGEEVALEYGSSLPSQDDRNEKVFMGYFLDEEGTLKYNGNAVNGLTVYPKWETGKYIVCLQGTEETTLYVLFGEAITSEELSDTLYWYDSEESTKQITFPYYPTQDCTLYGESTKRAIEEEEFVLTDTEKIAVICLVAAAVVIGLVVAYLNYKKKKERRNRGGAKKKPAKKNATKKKQ